MVFRSTLMLFIRIVVLIKCGFFGIFYNLIPLLPSIYSIKTYDFSTLYTTTPYRKIKARLSELIKNAFKYKNWKKRNEYIVVGNNSTYFVKNTSKAKNKYTEDDIVRMIDFLIDNIFVECGGVIF